MDEVVIKLKNVTKTYKLFENERKKLLSIFFKNVKYKEKYAVNNVSFEIKKGEAVAILGRNGAGKSTILKIVTGITFPTKGEVDIKGSVNALLEATASFDSMFTGRQNIYLKGQILGFSDKEIKDIEEKIIDFADIGEYIDQPVRTYSSGMKSRLGFAIDANINPEILIVDEALSVGDEEFKQKCIKKVKDIINNENVTLLFVTHQANLAREFCNRGIVMNKGEVIFDGDINEAINEYKEKCKK